MAKDIYASLQIADQEVRLLVAEWFNGRLHILKNERVAHQGIQNHQIVKANEIVQAIQRSLASIEKNVKLRVSQVILVVDSLDLRRVNKWVYSDVNDPLSRILPENIAEIYQKALSDPLDGQGQLTNVMVHRYRVNSAHTYKVPLHEKTSRLYADVDFYSIQKAYLYQMVELVESCGLKILDVVIDSLAIGHEASLLDFNSTKYQIAIQIEAQSTSLSMFYKGRLMSGEVLPIGYDRWVYRLAEKLQIPFDMAQNLMLNNVDLIEKNYSKDPISLWTRDNKSYTCSQLDLMKIVHEPIASYISHLRQLCQAILETQQADVVLVGSGAMMKGLDERLSQDFACPVTTYIPTTLGARSSSYVGLLGSFYYTIDHSQWTQVKQEGPMDQMETSEEEDSGKTSITQRLSQLMRK